MSIASQDRRWTPLAMTVSGLLAMIAVVLTVFSDSSWKVPLLGVVPICFIVAEVAIFRLHEENRALRRQAAKLEDMAGFSTHAPQPDAPKGAYSLDEEGRRRLHISRLE